MANIAALLKRIESGTLSYEEKLSALSQVEQSLQDMRQKKQEAIQSNVMLIVDALKQMQVKVEQQLEEAKAIVPQKGQKGDKGEKGERGLDGAPGKDGRNGIDGKDGKDGNDGISVTDAKIDFDGSLVITLSNGREINVGEVLPLEVSDKIKVIANGGGTSQTVVDTLTSLQNQINTLTGVDGVLGDMAQQNANNVAITGGAINGATIGATTPAAGTFTTLTATGQTSLGGAAGSESVRVITPAGGGGNYWQFEGSSGDVAARFLGSSFNIGATFVTRGSGNYNFATNTNASTVQARISHTASAVNYVQVTGAATGSFAQISAQGSDAITGLGITSKGAARINFFNNNGTNRQVSIGGNGAAAVNYLDLNGSATGIATSIGPAGTDTNIALAFQSKGTGAIDLAAGSSGVNISNGGTVTAITRTATGSGYTSFPSIAISAPTTAGGVQATASVTQMLANNPTTVQSGGTGYIVGDVLTVVGGTPTVSGATFTVTAVSGGAVTAVTATNFANYTALPTNPVTTTGGTGSGCTLNVTYGIQVFFTITNAGSGYVEQPTVSFSGGGGSGAAAYATVGSGTTIKGIGYAANNATIKFVGPSGVNQLELWDVGGANTWMALQNTQYNRAQFIAQGYSAGELWFSANGSGKHVFATNGTSLTQQFQVSHTASAVNYVQVTGAATGGSNYPTISAQGSDSVVNISVDAKGAANARLRTTATGGWVQLVPGTESFRAVGVASAVNLLQSTNAVAGSTPSLSSIGSDTNIDLALTTKGTGSINLQTGSGTQFKVIDRGSPVNFWSVGGAGTGVSARLFADGSDSTVYGTISQKGSGYINFITGATSAYSGGSEQLRINNTASAVNYVQVTGAATGSGPTISAQGSDANADLLLSAKGYSAVNIQSGGRRQFQITYNTGNTEVNYLSVKGANAGSAPVMSAIGSDTNIDLTLTPKGTGYVQFGTYTGTALTIAGYIEIKDSGGTVRKLAVVA